MTDFLPFFLMGWGGGGGRASEGRASNWDGGGEMPPSPLVVPLSLVHLIKFIVLPYNCTSF